MRHGDDEEPLALIRRRTEVEVMRVRDAVCSSSRSRKITGIDGSNRGRSRRGISAHLDPDLHPDPTTSFTSIFLLPGRVLYRQFLILIQSISIPVIHYGISRRLRWRSRPTGPRRHV